MLYSSEKTHFGPSQAFHYISFYLNLIFCHLSEEPSKFTNKIANQNRHLYMIKVIMTVKSVLGEELL